MDPALRQVDILSGHSVPRAVKKRRSYAREDKLRVLAFYKENRNNLYRTCQKFDINSKNLLRWLKDEKRYVKVKEEPGKAA